MHSEVSTVRNINYMCISANDVSTIQNTEIKIYNKNVSFIKNTK